MHWNALNGISLNDLLLPGPCLIPDLRDIILRWKRYKFVFITDIENMFRQILVHIEDRIHQLILWRTDTKESPKICMLNTITYGESPSPFLAIMALIQHVIDHGIEFPLALQIVLEESYVDDFPSGGDTIEEVKNKMHELTELLKVGRFPLRNGFVTLLN